MIVFNFTRLIYEKDIKHVPLALVNAGFSSNFATKVTRNEFVKLNVEYLERLCDFFNCTPNDLLEWIPDTDVKDVEKHHLHSLYRKKETLTISDKLRYIPLDKLEEISKLIDDKLASYDK